MMKLRMLHPIDIVTRDNQPTDQTSDPEDASNRGLWHRGIHIVVYTRDNQLLAQKRSATMIYHPGMLDISVGGFVDSQESPVEAAVRELHEETGIIIHDKDLQLISTTRYNHRWRYGIRRKISRTILYTYICQLPEDASFYSLAPQRDEVAWVGFLSLKSAQWLVRKHFLQRLGYLSPLYSYYRRIIRVTADAIRDNARHTLL